MTISTGHKSSAANKKETNTTYGGAPIACGSGDKLTLLSEGITLTKNIAPDKELIGNEGRRNPEVVGNRVAGPVTLNGRYEGLERVV